MTTKSRRVRVRVTKSTIFRDANMRKLIAALSKGAMLHSDVEELLHKSRTGARSYITELHAAGIISIARPDAAAKSIGHPVYHMAGDKALVDAYLKSIPAPVRASVNNERRQADTAELTVKVLACVAVTPRISGDLAALFKAPASSIYRILCRAAEEGMIHRTWGQRKDGGKQVLWAHGPGDQEDPRRGFAASRHVVEKWRAETVIDPLALPAAFFNPPQEPCAPVAHEVEPRPVVLTGFAALAQVRFEMQEARV